MACGGCTGKSTNVSIPKSPTGTVMPRQVNMDRINLSSPSRRVTGQTTPVVQASRQVTTIANIQAIVQRGRNGGRR